MMKMKFRFELSTVSLCVCTGWAKINQTVFFSESITLRRLVIERHVVCQKFQNFVQRERKTCMSMSLNIICLICISHHYT